MLPFKAVLVEGTSGVGKSTLIDALIRRHVSSSHPRKIRTLVHLAQSHTYGPLAVPEDSGTLTVDDNLHHLERIVSLIEWLHASVQEHVRPGVVKWNDVEAFDRRLAALGCKLLFLQVAPATIWERGIVPRADQQFILQYAKKFGRTHQEIHKYFLREQEVLAELFARSAMPKLLAQNDRGADQAVEAVEDAWRFWTADLKEKEVAHS
jgi:hypothetical protein